MKSLATVVVILTCVCQKTSAKGVGATAEITATDAKRVVVCGQGIKDDTSRQGVGHFEADTIREVSVAVGRHVKGDTIPNFNWSQKLPAYKDPFPLRSLILPGAMIAYGVTALKSSTLQSVNHDVKDAVWEDNPHKQFHLDNYLMFAPALTVYGLNMAGVHGAHNFKDRTMILLLSTAIAQGTAFTVKGWAHELRPSGNDYMSFPSGHTTEAFANAEFMRMEYKDVSPWYGVAGYAMATATGMLRMYNNAHWLSDVVAGAGVGMASTRIAYWLYPKLQHWLGGKSGGDNGSTGTVLTPTYGNGALGLSFVRVFR